MADDDKALPIRDAEAAVIEAATSLSAVLGQLTAKGLDVTLRGTTLDFTVLGVARFALPSITPRFARQVGSFS